MNHMLCVYQNGTPQQTLLDNEMFCCFLVRGIFDSSFFIFYYCYYYFFYHQH